MGAVHRNKPTFIPEGVGGNGRWSYILPFIFVFIFRVLIEMCQLNCCSMKKKPTNRNLCNWQSVSFLLVCSQIFIKALVFVVSPSAFIKWWFYAMASSHSSSPVPQSNSSDAFFKKEMDVAKRFRPVQSLPDVCPKEPTGNINVQGEWKHCYVC